jgi:hypothetical protein
VTAAPPGSSQTGPAELAHRAVDWVTDRPVLAGLLAAVVAAVVAAGAATRAAVARWRHARLARHACQVMLIPPPEVDPAGAAAWWATLAEVLAPSRWRRLAYGMPHVAVEYRWAGRRLTIAVWVPGTVPAGLVAAATRAAWPGAACAVTGAGPPVPPGALAEGGVLAPALPPWYPLRADHDTDPMRALVAAGSGLHADEHACVQVLARPATPRQVSRLRRGAATLRTGHPPGGVLDPAVWARELLDLATPGPSRARPNPAGRGAPRPAAADPLRDRDARPALDKAAAGPQWETAIRYAVTHTNPRGLPPADLKPRLVTLAHGLASAYGAYTARNRLRRRRLRAPAAALAARRLTRGWLLSVPELAAIAALPTDPAVPGLDRARAKPAPAPVAVPGGGRGTKALGRAEVGGHAVALPVADARHHVHLLGATGSGKSTQLCHLILDDIRAHRGVVVIDPKGDLVVDVLDRLPPDPAHLADLAGRLVLIDPDQPGGATLNPLAGPDHDLVVDNIVSIFAKIFARHWGPRIDDVLRVACLTLLRKAEATLTLVPPLLNDKQFRAPFTVDLDDPEGLRGFWEWYESTPPPLRAQVIGPVLARLRAFLLRDFVRRTLGTPRSSFDMARLLDHGGILLARLPKGQIGEDTARLMGSFVLASVWQAATARARRPEASRRDAAVYIDECHNFLNLPGSVADMLAEARGYRLSLILAHQNLTQLPRDTQLALSANARNKIFFACAPEDAHQLARHTLPELDEHDLAHLDAYTAATRLVIDSRQTPAFTLRTNPPRPVLGHTAAIRAALARADNGDPGPTDTAPIAATTTGPTGPTGPVDDPATTPVVPPVAANRPAPPPPTPNSPARRPR